MSRGYRCSGSSFGARKMSQLLFQGQLAAGHAWLAVPEGWLAVTLLGRCGEAGRAGKAKGFKKAGCPALGCTLGR